MSTSTSPLEEAQSLASSNPFKAEAIYKQILNTPAGAASPILVGTPD
jgi:hypothetical protein